MADLGEAGHLPDIHDGVEISIKDKGNFAVIDGGKILKFQDDCLISLSQSVGKTTVHFEKGDYLVVRQKGRYKFRRHSSGFDGVDGPRWQQIIQKQVLMQGDGVSLS
jgi:hypothetical protein